MLYGVESRSSHRHLDGDRAFHRNSLDIFQIATPHSLGSVWKIHVWHDNKGLSPAWFLQHVIVRDLQTARSTFFLVNDWLLVETEANGGLVEKEVLAATASLSPAGHLLCPPHVLFLGTNAVWYGVLGDAAYSVGPVSSLIPLSADMVAVGLVSSLVVYPVYLVILFLFWMSRSRVAGGPSSTPSGQQVLDVDSCLDSSVLDSSFLTFPGLRAERLVRGQMGHVLGAEDDGLSLVSPSLPTKYFSASDEDLIRQILAEGASSLVPTQNTQAETDLLPGL
ncbi:Polycystin-1 [Manis javanica]|nr:Polycystin-1 [Manis javanica]